MRVLSSPSNDATLKLLREWPQRLLKIRAYIAHKLAHELKTQVLNGIPNKKEYLAYRKSLRVVSVQGAGKSSDIFALYSFPKAVGVKSLDVACTLIFVEPKKGKKKGIYAAKVLQSHGPWTVDTIPFMPKASEANLSYKKVSVMEKTKVTALRKRERPKWTRDLSKVGVSVRSTKDVDIGNVKAFPDTALQALRLEFGLGGEKAVGHWRPAQRFVTTNSVKRLHLDKNLVKAFSDVRYKAWVSWPPRTPGTPLKTTDLKKFAGFQDKVRIKVLA